MPIQKANTYFAIIGKVRTILFTRKLDAIYQHANSKSKVKYREIPYKTGQRMLQEGKAILGE